MQARALALGAYLAMAGSSLAFVQTFEGFATGTFTGGGTGGYPVDIGFYPVGGAGTFDIVDLGLGSNSWQYRTLLPYDGISIVQMDFNFSTVLSAVAIDMGDFDSDDDYFFLEAYSGLDGTGSMLGSDYAFYASSRDISYGDFETLSVAAPGIRSIVAWGVGVNNYTNSYMDNLDMTPVPEPASLAVLGLGALALIRRKR